MLQQLSNKIKFPSVPGVVVFVDITWALSTATWSLWCTVCVDVREHLHVSQPRVCQVGVVATVVAGLEAFIAFKICFIVEWIRLFPPVDSCFFGDFDPPFLVELFLDGSEILAVMGNQDDLN